MQRGVLHRQPVGLQLLAGDDDVHVVPRPQAMVVGGQQGVGIRWQIDPDYLGALVQHHINKPRILMSEPVVVLPPHVRGEQVVQARQRPPPRHLGAGLEPLGVLIEHRINDVAERLVAGEHAVPAGEQVALQKTLADVLGQHLDDPAPPVEPVIVFADPRLPVAAGDLQNVAQPVADQFVRGEGQEVVRVEPGDVA